MVGGIYGETGLQIDYRIVFAGPLRRVSRDVIEVVILVVQVIPYVGLKRGKEAIFDIRITVIEAGISGARIQLVTSEARIQARSHQVPVAQQFRGKRSQRYTQIERIDERPCESRVSRHVGQHLV